MEIKNGINDNGYLNLIIGPMFSGKSTRLINYIRMFKKLELNIIIIKPTIDIRYTINDEICTHDMETEKCLLFDIDKLNDIFKLDTYKNTQLFYVLTLILFYIKFFI